MPESDMPPHPTHLWPRARTYVRQAPGTYIWLAALFVTTVALHHMTPAFETTFLRQRSTNLHELSQNPVRVLVASAFWIDGSSWWPYAALYTLLHAPTEHRLGTPRWLAVVAASHILATLISEGALLWAIRHGHAPTSAVNTLDVGVSYALAGVAAVLTHLIPSPWRYAYLAAVLTVYGLPLLTGTGRTFTDLGHATAVLIGLSCRPLTRAPTPTPLTPCRKPPPPQ
ncbi:rhomboid-like protein [Streptomyces sp. NPDC050145]|uniref:rhomboid-like protein n=1 Tax=Streptomyces sp. NPDC050145 TaxID=3365602 RepID=UPI0037B24D8D